MAIDPNNTDAVAIPQLPDLILQLETFLVAANADGKMGKFTANQLATFIAPYIAAVSNSGYIIADSNVLPNPTDKDGGFTIVGGPDTFTQTTGGNITTTGKLSILAWNGTTWSIAFEVFIDLSNYATKDEIAPLLTILDVINISKNLVDKSTLLSGSYNLANGNVTASNNWLRTPQIVLPVGETTFTVSGLGGISTGSARLTFYQENGAFISSVAGLGASNTNPVTFTVPALTYKVGINIANATNIGLTPTNNQFSGVIMLEVGSSATAYEPFGTTIEVGAIDYPIEATDERIEAKIDDVTIPSVNLVNMLTEPLSGYYPAGSGGTTASNNWIRTPRYLVDPTTIGQQFTISGYGNITAAVSVVSIRNAGGSVIYEILGSGLSAPDSYTFTMPVGAYDIGFSIANEVGIGLIPFNNQFTYTFQWEAGAVATEPHIKGEVFVDGSKIINWPDDMGGFDESDVIVTKNSSTSFYLYYHSGKENNKWIRIQWIRATVPASFVDTWKLNEGFVCTRVSDTTFTPDMQFIRDGVWENAIYTGGGGYTNALGSTHGWEMLIQAHFMVDNVLINPSGSDTVWVGKLFKAFQPSNFKNVAGSANVALSTKEWSIFNRKLTVRNEIDWFTTLTPGWNSYMSMCSVLRKTIDLAGQVTHSAIPNDDMLLYDVSEEGFTTAIYYDPASTTPIANPKRDRIVIWGDKIKVDMKVKVREVTLANGTFMPKGLAGSGMYVQNTALYNKLYGAFGGMTVNNGDKWVVETEYLISAI